MGLGHGFQSVMGRMTGLAATTAIIAQASGQPDSYVLWIFSLTLAVCGVGTILQAHRFWRFGSGYPIGVASGSAYIAVVIAALEAGGPTMLSSLLVAAAMLQFVLASRLSLLRRLVTPTVTGTVLMLLAASVTPVLLGKLSATPEGASASTVAALAAVTFAIIMGLRLFGPPRLQQWGPVIGIIAGCVAAVPAGLLDLQPFLDAPWIGIPLDARPHFEPGLGPEFWALLPGFVLVHLSVSIYSMSDMMAIQRAAWRRPRSPDFRVLQGALHLLAATNVAAAVVGALPNQAPSANSARIVLTGVAARSTAVYGGAIIIAVAFLPKVIALVTAIPGAVFGAYVIVMLAVLFVQGMRLVVEDGLDARKSAIVGVSFWLGVGFQGQLIFPDLVTGPWATLLGNGLTTGSISLICFTLLLEAASPPSARLRTTLAMSALPAIDALLRNAATRAGWNEASTDRLRSAGEEALSSLLPLGDGRGDDDRRRLVVSVRPAGPRMELEFVATSDRENLEDHLAYLSDQPQVEDGDELSFRLLRHYAASVRHHKYYGLDIVTVEVPPTA